MTDTHFCSLPCMNEILAIKHENELYDFLMKHSSTIWDMIDEARDEEKILDLLVNEDYLYNLMRDHGLEHSQIYQKHLSQKFLKRMLSIDLDEYVELHDLHVLLDIFNRIEIKDDTLRYNLLSLIFDNFDDWIDLMETSGYIKQIIEIIESFEIAKNLFKLMDKIWHWGCQDAILSTIVKINNNEINKFFKHIIREGKTVEFHWLKYIQTKEIFAKILCDHLSEVAVSDFSLDYFELWNPYDEILQKYDYNDFELSDIVIKTKFETIVYPLLDYINSLKAHNLISKAKINLDPFEYLQNRYGFLPLKNGNGIQRTLLLDEFKKDNLQGINAFLEGQIEQKMIDLPPYWYKCYRDNFDSKKFLVKLISYQDVTNGLNELSVVNIIEIYNSLINQAKFTDNDIYNSISMIKISDNHKKAIINVTKSKQVLEKLAGNYKFKGLRSLIKDKIQN